ncbi:MAG: 2OG-Fe(II) oxygenase [Gammaproteobacteria bacterium]|nr:2OG-Fe(II) oxygenase [Gammaproteobacteria bacterium]
MSHSQVKHIEKEDIPVIDIAVLFDDEPDYERVGNELRRAAESVGFFYVKNHCISSELMAQVAGISRGFFHRGRDEKSQVLARDTHRGLLGFGGAKMTGHHQPDLKESYIWGADLAADNLEFLSGNKMFAPNIWPGFMPEMRAALNQYMAGANHCGQQLLKAFASSLGIEHDYFVRTFDEPISRGTLIHYPPLESDQDVSGNQVDRYGVSPHTDFGTLTLLAQDDTGGLRVKDRQGNWLTAHPIENTLVVNVGDLLARWTNDRFQSTVHAVVNNSGRERYSIVVAVDPNWETEVTPVVLGDEKANYGTVRCGEYIQRRFDHSFNYEKRE